MNQKLVIAAISGLLLSTACTKAKEANGIEAPGKCWGANACKGKGECRGGANNSCEAKNACKGMAWAEKAKSECDKVGGTFESF